ncbi:hypothetical protein MUK42_33952 [Musa troglodytarum]|uniref:Uncharacterized protein n=1 Tax=Musa troglodytarum TaxID=320322 RepID=A0A9E7FJS2_9LILI|nr:hypothetical protein MUK42_33952 [Musa troglodytarum]
MPATTMHATQGGGGGRREGKRSSRRRRPIIAILEAQKAATKRGQLRCTKVITVLLGTRKSQDFDR